MPIHIQALIVDMDGVLWRGEQPIGDLPAIFQLISEHGLQITLATNNATLSVSQYIDKLLKFGVHLQSDQIVNSSLAVAHYLHAAYPHGGSVFIVGEIGLAETLKDKGFSVLDALPENENSSLPGEIIAVVAAMDRNVTYEKITAATRLIRLGVPFIGTNPDRTFPTPQGLIPGAGAILAAIEAASDVKPVIVGKPSPEMYLVALERMKVSPEHALVVGDRLETDIAGGQKIGCRTALVLSGVTSLDAAQIWQPQPDAIFKDFSALVEAIDTFL